MSHNPYSPPAAPVMDAAAPERPRSVKVALWLFWISLGIGIFVWAQALSYVNSGEISGLRYPGMLIGILAPAWFYLKIGQGRNWARITVLVIVLVRAVVVHAPMLKDWRLQYFLDRTTFFAVIIEQILVYTALFLVFFPGREWFKRRTTEKS